jgi:hypothetical protein
MWVVARRQWINANAAKQRKGKLTPVKQQNFAGLLV